MKKSIVLPFLLLFFYFSSAQEVYFTHGKNLTNYEQLNINTNSLPVDRGIGSSFEIGFKSKYIKNTSFFYTLGLTYNQFNALGNTTGLNMEWKTNYVGLSSSFDYSLIQAKYLVSKIRNIYANFGLWKTTNQSSSNGYFEQ
jgi:hypothetical protein